MLCLPIGALAAYAGYRAASEQFTKVSQLTIYESRVSMWRVRSNFRWMGAMGYSFPVMIRTFTFVAFLLGVPALAGVYCDDTDHVLHYAVSSGVGAVLVSLMTSSREFRGIRQKIVAAGLGMLPGVAAGIFFSQAQKHDVYPFYDSYCERWRRVDPMWSDFEQRAMTNRAADIVVAESYDLEQTSVGYVEQNDPVVDPVDVTSDEQSSVERLKINTPSVSPDYVHSSNHSIEDGESSDLVGEKL